MAELVVFHHIPKTAGRSIRAMLKENYDHTEMAESYGAPADPQWYRLWWESFPPAERGALRCVAGHTANVLLSLVDRPTEALCVLRHPVDRVLSLHAFARKSQSRAAASMPGWKRGRSPTKHSVPDGASIEEIYRCEAGDDDGALGDRSLSPFFNGQTALLAAAYPHLREPLESRSESVRRSALTELIDRMELAYSVGLQEHLDQCVESFAARFGWLRASLPRRNVGKTRVAVADLEPASRDLILAHNDLDLALHEHFSRALAPAPPHERRSRTER